VTERRAAQVAKEADKGSLVSRWKKSAQASAALPGIIEALKSGGHLGAESSPFGRVGDLCDVRGLQVPDGMRILSRHVKDADFSWGFIRLAWIQNCVFENVRFDNATIDTADHGNRFTGCSFVGTSFQDGIGYRGSSYNNCRFEKVDFRRSVFTRADMNDCIFSDCKLKGVDFNASSFVNCMFEGKLEDVWFRGGFPLPVNVTDFGEPRPNRMQGVSFANASLWGITFSNGCDLSSVVVK
jgi:fluoroquinolone resistance protein